ncbi:MAG: SMC-Scp complex subunit ScpB [Gammaproteobacteria bacterium]|nr:SMC-Scp complex subunit ScpB [Gammaproteobacteria bacterium]
MEKEQLKKILEAVLMAASSPMKLEALLNVFEDNQRPESDDLKAALDEMVAECEERSYELKLVSSGYRYQVKKDYSDYVSRLWEEKPARYSRALLETLSLIAYRQPITRGEIEAVRGVSVSSTIIKTLDERSWVKVVGHRDVPGKPALYATTKEFLDYFNIASLDDLPSLQEIRDIDAINAELDLRMPDENKSPSEEGSTTESSDENETIINLEMAEDESESTASSSDVDSDGEQGDKIDAASASASAEH